jgi:hypothetical protein
MLESFESAAATHAYTHDNGTQAYSKNPHTANSLCSMILHLVVVLSDHSISSIPCFTEFRGLEKEQNELVLNKFNQTTPGLVSKMETKL